MVPSVSAGPAPTRARPGWGPALPRARGRAGTDHGTLRRARHPALRSAGPGDLGSVPMRLAVIPGDGIGPEVVAEGLKVLGGVAPDIESTTYDLGAARWQRTGELLPDTVLEELRGHDAILLGAVGDPTVPSGILERGLL